MREGVVGTPPIKGERMEQRGVRKKGRNKLGEAKPPKAKPQEGRRNGARSGKQWRDGDRWQWGAWGQEARVAGHKRAGGQSCPRGGGGGGAECRPSRERDREKES